MAGGLSRSLRKSAKRRSLAHRRFRKQLIEQLENRELMALSILSVSPLDGSTSVPLDSNLVFTFNEPVNKGQGNIYVVRQGTGTTGVAVDVNSSNVTVDGAIVTVDLPIDLQLDNSYFVHIDSGSFLDRSSTPTSNATLLTQSFDFLPLGPKVFEANGTGSDWTPTPPLGFQSRLDNPNMEGVGAAEWRGWTFARKDFWIGADNQGRDQFVLGNGTLAIGDSDEYDDGPGAVRPFQSTLITKAVNLNGVAENSVKLEFDSSFRPEDNQIGRLSVSYDGGTNWTQLLELNPTNTDNDAPFAKRNINERLVTGSTTGGGVAIGSVNNPTSGSLLFSYYTEGGNDWWWALDDLLITGNIVGVPFAGLSDQNFWNFATPESPKLTLTIDRQAMSENGGTATGTVSRNNLPTGDVVVTLSSSDATEATVPATVTIPDGQSSVTFAITAVDDTLSDRTQTVTITATSAVYAASSASIRVTDDEGPKVVTLTPPDNSTGVNDKSNFTVTFDTNVKKGTGSIYIIDAATNTAAEQIDITSAAVTVADATVTFDPSINLFGLTDYYILIDDGAILDTSADLTSDVILHKQSFDFLRLSPFTTEPNGDGTDFTKNGPLGYSVDNSRMPASNSDFHGWVFMDKNSWIATEGDQSRSRFSLGSGTVAVADSDAWDDTPHDAGRMNTFLETPAIDLTGITPGSVVLEFDSSFYPELPQYGTVEVSYDNGGNWNPLLFFGDANNTNEARNNRIVVGSSNTPGQLIGGATVDAPLQSPASGLMKFRFAYREGENNWWWALDDMVIRGEKAGIPFAGIEDPAVWNIRTAEAPTLTVTIDRASMNENGGIATGTVTRNLTTEGDSVVSLVSSDTTEATVPATVTIPNGQASVTFTITGVDDTVPDGPKTAIISATAVDYFNVSASIIVEDDDFPKIVSITPLDNATDVSVGSNIVVQFDQGIRKGNGTIYLVRTETGKAEVSIDVNSSLVTIVGDTMTINPVVNLTGLKDFSIRIDRGAVISTLQTLSVGTTLLTQDFELLALKPAILEQVGITPNGRDFTATPPEGWSVNNGNMARGGAPEWTGWTFADKNFWQTQGGQSRANFTLGTGTVAVADTDEWQDYARENDNFNSGVTTIAVDLDSVEPNTVRLEFDSSFRPESGSSFVSHVPTNMQGFLDVSYDNGTTWTNLLTLDTSNTLGSATAPNVNERRVVNVPNPDTGSMKFRFINTGTNDWWWAIDNILVTGNTVGLPFPGLVDPTVANFATADTSTLSVTVPQSVAENAGTASGTVSRNLGTTGAVVVTLSSSNTAVATVPETVTIPDGQSSVDFVITLLDNALFNATWPVKFTASATGFVLGESTSNVTDNEAGSVIITEIMYDPAGAEQSTEWIEIINRGTTTADMSGWRLDDEDKQNWGAIPNGSLLAPGEIAVLYNRFFGLISETTFRTDWSVPESAKVFGVDWSMEDDGSNKGRGGLFNAPTDSNEILTLADAASTVLNTVNFAEDGTLWPAYSNGSSLYLFDASTDNNVGTNWRSARVGVDGSRRPTGSVFSTSDIGSPGRVVQNASPVLTVANAAVTGNEGTAITNSGTWSDANVGDVVTLSASLGSVVKNDDGTWIWSINGLDDTPATNVTISAVDTQGGFSSVSFTYAVTNRAPQLTVTATGVSGAVLSTLTNTGTWADVAADTVTLTASLGTVTKNSNGTWSWSLPTTVAINNQTVTITGTDEDGGSSNVTFTIDALVAVVNSKVYYLRSSFDGSGVDAALDTGKSLAKSGSEARPLTFDNVINNTRGINGLVFDVAGLAATTLTASDIAFRMSPIGSFNEAANPPSSWAAAPAPTNIVVTEGTSSTPARVRIEWADGAIVNRWLQIKILDNANTGLRSPQVYYLGHLLGETTGTLSGGSYVVQVADVLKIRPDVGSPANVSNILDINKNGLIQVSDILAFRTDVGLLSLRNITIPAAGSGSEGEGYGRFSLLAPSPNFGSTEKLGTNQLIIAPRWTGRIYNEPEIAWLPAEQAVLPAVVLAPMPEVENDEEERDSNLDAIDKAFSEINEPLSPVWKV